VKIRQAIQQDIEALQTLSMQNHEFHLEQSPDYFNKIDKLYKESDWQGFIENSSCCVLVIEDDSNVIGFALIRLINKNVAPHLREKRTAFISDFCIHQNWRGRGLGKKLFQACEEWAREQNAEELGLAVWTFNNHAIQLYEAMGMRDIYRQMRKPL
jgi:diamine N-acetyltransferase